MTNDCVHEVLEGLVMSQITHRRTIQSCATTQVQPDGSKEALFTKFYEYLAVDKTTARITPIVRQLICKHGVFPIVMTNFTFWGSVEVFKKCVNRYGEFSDIVAIALGVLMTCPGINIILRNGNEESDFHLEGDSVEQAICYALRDALCTGSVRAFDALARFLSAKTIRAVPHWLEYTDVVSLMRYSKLPDIDVCAGAVTYDDMQTAVKSCTVLKRTDKFPVSSIVLAAQTCGYDVDALLAELE